MEGEEVDGKQSDEEAGNQRRTKEDKETGRQLRRQTLKVKIWSRIIGFYNRLVPDYSTWKPLMRLRPWGDLELRAVVLM